MSTAGPSNDHLLAGNLLRGLLSLAGPMFLGALLQNLQSLIDLFWVGRLGSASVAALALSGTVLMLLFPLIMGMATGTVAMVARRVGEGNVGAAAAAAGNSLGLSIGLGIVAASLGYPLAGKLCALLGAAPEVAGLAESYLRVSFAGSFTVLMLFIGNSALQAAGNVVAPMTIMGLTNLVNLILDPILIFGMLGLPALGVQGAAVATVLAQAFGAGVVLFLLHSGHVRIHMRRRDWRPVGATTFTLLRVGIPGSGQMLARSLMALVLMRIVASHGTTAVAAYGIGLRFHMIMLMPAFALGNAAATMVGQNLGAGKPDRATAAAWWAVGIDMGIMAVAAAALFLFAAPLVRIFDSHAGVVAVGAAYLRTTSGFYLFTALAIVLGRGLQGAGDTVAPMICTIISLWGLQVPLAIFLSARLEPPTQGIWWAIAVAVTCHGLLVSAWFQLGKWKARNV